MSHSTPSTHRRLSTAAQLMMLLIACSTGCDSGKGSSSIDTGSWGSPEDSYDGSGGATTTSCFMLPIELEMNRGNLTLTGSLGSLCSLGTIRGDFFVALSDEWNFIDDDEYLQTARPAYELIFAMEQLESILDADECLPARIYIEASARDDSFCTTFTLCGDRDGTFFVDDDPDYDC